MKVKQKYVVMAGAVVAIAVAAYFVYTKFIAKKPAPAVKPAEETTTALARTRATRGY